MFSSNRNLNDAFPHARTYTFRVRSSSPRWERNYPFAGSFADQEMSRTISGLTGVADEQTLDKLQMQVSRLETNGRAYLGVYLRSYGNCAQVDQTEQDTPASYAFRRNDAIVGIGSFTVTDSNSLRRALLTIEPGVPVSVRFYRNGNLEQTTITPASASVGQMPYSHRALGIAYKSLGRNSEAEKQFESFRQEAPYSSDDMNFYSSGNSR
jgi:predicted metalloprotease with PDZ domain